MSGVEDLLPSEIDEILDDLDRKAVSPLWPKEWTQETIEAFKKGVLLHRDTFTKDLLHTPIFPKDMFEDKSMKTRLDWNFAPVVRFPQNVARITNMGC